MSFGSERRMAITLFMRRSEIIATCVAPVRSASNASVSCMGWKLPLETIASRSTMTIGLSPIPFSSTSTECSAARTCSRYAPLTWAATLNESGSCTESTVSGSYR